MSNVLKFPTPNFVEPTTPEGWRKALYAAGDKVVLAQLYGEDPHAARAEFDAISARLPREVRDDLEGRMTPERVAKLTKNIETAAKAGWDIFKLVQEIKSKLGR